ncbi:uncharacterized protein ARB_02364 [Trichophyton benhamiae CBS 112371]|uniref:Uncharacterized protein n=1 Tax=Arthroderma benhamiae (strain ATCC MYA-4681 / CBS 112371) TaxID=663331 RepID=D4B1N5_ARTBC|nr:uncharacterized protein ARB_02364 [Trichophyton benhamiae CBS 112371]EFE30667.1 hypothetical protein ARB_02364 [Trichophyton benhamiae CBS 112371]
MSPQRQDPLLHNDARLSNKRERERERRDDDKTEETERQNDASGDWKTRTKEDNKEVADGGRWLKEAEEAMLVKKGKGSTERDRERPERGRERQEKQREMRPVR